MKNTIFLAVAALFFTASVNAQSTVDSIEAKYKSKMLPMPEALTIEKTFPVLGTYHLNTADSSAAGAVTVTMDSASKGIVWVDGLPEGRFKAYLRQSPSTYRIIPQTTESGKKIPEGTLIFSPESNTLNVAIGAPYNEAEPAAIFGTIAGAATTDSSATAAAPTSDVATSVGAHEAKIKTKKANGAKTKTKLMLYTLTKANQTTTTSAPVQQQQQQQQ